MSTRKGKAFVFGDNIDTDVLAPGVYMKGSMEELARHCLEAVDPQFAATVKPGDVVVGGENFGMGSSREQAAAALLTLGISAVVAKSFARIFYRNAMNLGLPVLICERAGEIAAGDALEVDPAAGTIRRAGDGAEIPCEPIPEHLMAMIEDGGLIPHLEKKLKGKAA